jgi:hypothetical protein
LESGYQVKASESRPRRLSVENNNSIVSVNALSGNWLINKFPRKEILGKQCVAKLRNNRVMSVNIITSGNELTNTWS